MEKGSKTFKKCCMTCVYWGVEAGAEFHLRECRITNKDTNRLHNCDRYRRCNRTITTMCLCSRDDRYKDAIDHYRG